jgi:hypothetical protein
MAKNAFTVFIPMSTDSDARKRIVFDFFDLLAAVAARGKTNGLGGRKLSRMAGWWAFEHSDGGKGFDGGYKSWARYAFTVTKRSVKRRANLKQGRGCNKPFIFCISSLTLTRSNRRCQRHLTATSLVAGSSLSNGVSSRDTRSDAAPDEESGHDRQCRIAHTFCAPAKGEKLRVQG